MEDHALAASWRTWLPLIAGGLAGFALGLGVGYFAGYPLYGTGHFGYIVVPIGITVVLVIVLGVWAAASHSHAPLLALASLLVLGFVGTLVAPSPTGVPSADRGRVSIGTDADPEAYLASGVRCEWTMGPGGPYVADVRDIGWTVGDPSLFEALDLAGPVVVDNVHLGSGERPIGREAAIEFGDDQESRHGSFTAFDLVTVASDGTSGTARSKDGTLFIAWSCS